MGERNKLQLMVTFVYYALEEGCRGSSWAVQSTFEGTHEKWLYEQCEVGAGSDKLNCPNHRLLKHRGSNAMVR